MRIGLGVDVHRFSQDENRMMNLACLEWPGVIGCDGHSDADVAAHAVCDALLSAAGLGDLGSVFGVDDQRWANASGSTLLNHVGELIAQAGYRPINVSVQIMGNRPRLSERRAEAEAAMSKVVGAPVSVSATTTDGLGLTGRGEGLAAIATVLLATLDQ